MSYFNGTMVGNQQDARLGPAVAPTSIGTLVTLGEPLSFRSVVLSNTTAGALTYICHVVAPGDTAVAGNQVIPTVNIPPNDTLTYEFGANGIPVSGGGAPPANDTIQHVASGTGLNVTAVFTRRQR